jgi:hypothetical protein
MIKTASAKSKGRLFQQRIRDRILEYLPQLEPDDVVSTSMGAGGEDIKLSPAARKLFPYSCECKARAAMPVQDWFNQAKTNSPAGAEPILFLKKDRHKPLVVIDLEHFFKLLENQK